MKFNITHALLGLAALAVALKLAGNRAAQAQTKKPEAGPINAPAQWWTYAGSWNVPSP